MQLIRPSTDLDAKDALILQAAEATYHLASVLASTNERFWSFPTDRLLAVLNADVDATLLTFEINSELAAAVNSSLDALNLPQFSRRAPTEQGRDDIMFDGAAFIYNAPAETQIEPDAETQIEPDAETQIEPDAETQIEPDAETQIEPDAETQIEPDAETQIEPEP